MTERGMTAVLVHESSEQMVGSVCMGAYRLVYQSPKDLLMAERWRDMLLCPLYITSLAKTGDVSLIQERGEMGYLRYRTSV